MPDRTNGIIGELITREKYRFVSAALLAEIVRDAMGLVEAEAKAPNVDFFAAAPKAVDENARSGMGHMEPLAGQFQGDSENESPF